ncbi:type VI secretion system membrane subunit TssM [Novosphingobium sp. PC22D]|uniref:type VI secretion system membrane subunit TssM n=1 Tax=Novosphingobium sp. PC22D TaxID=1962403 RepID=UPI001F0A5B28|nr:type VI secretion system membrane subunit TssM [Novosphingobium sp. PC22D]
MIRSFFRRIFRNWWVLTITLVVISCLVLSVGLPMVVARMQPLWIRLSLSGAVIFVWLIFVFLRLRKARKAARALEEELNPPSAADEEEKLLAERMGKALASLREATGKRRNYLYTRPWYVIIGPPGAGKTTALLNSGLRFPFAEQSAKGLGGTRNLDFWFADEAVLVDTAGRYTSQDSDEEVDRRGWGRFLSLLRKHRPLQPVNGIIVAIGVDELVAADCARIDYHAAAVRRRLAELRRTLEVAPPVYVMITKSDLLAGMTEYFADLDVEGRRAVLGSTFDYAAGRYGADQIARAFDEMTQAAVDRQAKRLLEEPDQARRSLILGFPSQLQSIRARVMRFIDGAVLSAPESQTGRLRGFYFTSGVQEGTPLDRIMSSMAEVYDVDQNVSNPQQGRAYFLSRLLREVMIPEAGLVVTDPRAQARKRAVLASILGAIGLASALILVAWGVSFFGNRGFQDDLVREASAAEAIKAERSIDLRQVRGSDADLADTLPLLNALRNLPYGYARQLEGGPPWSMRFGLFQQGLADQAAESYRDALRRVVLPRLLLRLEDYMRTNRQDALALYEPLKAYLMLGGRGPMDKDAVEAWVTRDWATQVYPGADRARERQQLNAHLKALLTDPNITTVWAGRKAPLDGELVAASRASILTLSAAERGYALMRQKANAGKSPWRMANVLSQGDALAFADPERVMSTQIPFFFTRTGYQRSYLVGLATVAADLRNDLWMFGPDANNEGLLSEIGDLRPGIANLYASDYIAAWDNAIAVLEPGSYFSDPVAFGAITKSPSPLKKVLSELRKNTTFEGGVQQAGERVLERNLSRTRIGRFAQDVAGDGPSGLDAASEITNYFKPVHDYVGDGESRGEIDEFVAALKDAGKAIIAARSIGGGGGADATQANAATAIAEVQAAAAGAPPQLQEFVKQATQRGSTARISAATGAITDAYTQSVMPACREVAMDKYPFSERRTRMPRSPISSGCSASGA